MSHAQKTNRRRSEFSKPHTTPVNHVTRLPTRFISGAFQHLQSAGKPVSDDLLRHVAPLGWNHISLTGDYLWTQVTTSGDGFRSLNVVDEAV